MVLLPFVVLHLWQASCTLRNVSTDPLLMRSSVGVLDVVRPTPRLKLSRRPQMPHEEPTEATSS